ncbi:MAG: sterol desaturase family protein [Acidobacteria bacterium]|nr:sterol desaturase family protein [Acidobacteriota bacterium]
MTDKDPLKRITVDDPAEVSRRNIVTTAVVLVSMILSCYVYFGLSSGSLSEFFSKIDGDIYWMFAFLLPFPFAVLVSYIWPAVKNQKLFSASILLDLAYHIFRFTIGISLLAALMPTAKVLYEQYLSFLTIEISTGVPVWIRMICVLLFADLLGWLHHYIRHRVRVLWYFHMIHHSQREMNYFTDSRVHLFDRVWSTLLVVVPTLMIRIPVPSMLFLLTVMSLQRFFYHSNLKSNFGILRYLLVTPQSHRIHHSTLPEHFNRNFGVNLSIWDHLFGTQYRNYDEYPETGLGEIDYPYERKRGALDIINTFGAQFLYPFGRVYRDLSIFIRKTS